MIPANYSTISFPSLGIEVNPGRTLALGPLTIHYYGLIIAIGLMLAVVYACRRCSQFGIKQDDLLDGVLWVTPFAILCARAYYCIFSWADYAENPISVLYIWNGGLAIYGGVLGAVAGILLLCRIKKIKIGALLDMVALGFLIGQSIGRWATSSTGKPSARRRTASSAWGCTTPSPAHGNTTTPRSCTSRCGTPWALCCCTFCPSIVSMTEKSPWGTWRGTVLAAV